MTRMAFVMFLKPGYIQEYTKRHNKLFPEMKEALKEFGASNYSIHYHEETNQLFAYLEVGDKDKYNKISKTEACQKWWKYMAPLMEVNPDNSPVCVELSEVFYLE